MLWPQRWYGGKKYLHFKNLYKSYELQLSWKSKGNVLHRTKICLSHISICTRPLNVLDMRNTWSLILQQTEPRLLFGIAEAQACKLLLLHKSCNDRVSCGNFCASGWHIMYFLLCEINADICERLCKTVIFTKMAQGTSTVDAHAYFTYSWQGVGFNAAELSRNAGINGSWEALKSQKLYQKGKYCPSKMLLLKLKQV